MFGKRVIGSVIQLESCMRHFSLSTSLNKNLRSAVKKVTQNRTQALTYEEAQKPEEIGVHKAWNSWNTSNLSGETQFTSQTTYEDVFIRNFIFGTWSGLFVCETIIKRRQNMIIICGIVSQDVSPRSMYFLKGYSEELLSLFLKRPVKMEIQSVNNAKDMIFKMI